MRRSGERVRIVRGVRPGRWNWSADRERGWGHARRDPGGAPHAERGDAQGAAPEAPREGPPLYLGNPRAPRRATAAAALPRQPLAASVGHEALLKMNWKSISPPLVLPDVIFLPPLVCLLTLRLGPCRSLPPFPVRALVRRPGVPKPSAAPEAGARDSVEVGNLGSREEQPAACLNGRRAGVQALAQRGQSRARP